MTLQRTASIVLILPLLLAACYSNKREALNPGSCITGEVSYSQYIRPVVQSTCLTCHSAAVAGSSGRSVNLEGHTNLQQWALNGQLMKSIRHSGAPAMPQGGPKLDDCTIEHFQAWVTAGAPNN